MTSEAQKKKFENCYKSGHLNRYTCEFDVLPNILPELYAKGVIDNYEMTHPSEWRNILKEKGIKSDFGIDEITVEEEVKDGETRFIYTFPEPLVAPNCYFSILVFDKNKDWRYFTLEKDNKFYPCPDVLIDNLALVCGQKGYEHEHYSRWCTLELDDFKRHVQEIIDNKPYNKCEEGIKFFDPNKLVEFKIKMEVYEALGLEDEFKKDNCSIF